MAKSNYFKNMSGMGSLYYSNLYIFQLFHNF